VSVWVIDETPLVNGLVVHIRLFCKKHEKDWKDAKKLEYKKLNGVMLLRLPYKIPIGLWSNILWSDFLTLITNHFGDENSIKQALIPAIVGPCEEFLKKNPKFVSKGNIDECLKKE
jgi:hypothetical protein